MKTKLTEKQYRKQSAERHALAIAAGCRTFGEYHIWLHANFPEDESGECLPITNEGEPDEIKTPIIEEGEPDEMHHFCDCCRKWTDHESGDCWML